MTRTAAISLLSALVLLAGCTNASIIEDRDSVKRIHEITSKKVVVWHTYSDEETSVFENEVIPRFEAEHPDIRIESVRQTHNQEYLSALMARVSAGKTPDVIRMDYSWVPLFARRGLLHPLDEYEQLDIVASELGGPMLDSNRYGGHLYGLPLNMTVKAAIYNRKLLQEAGLAEPPSSMETLIEIARRNGDVIGMAGISLWQSLPYFMALGGQLADDQFETASGYLNGPASVKAVETLRELYREGILNPHMFDGKADLWADVYASDDLLMIDEGPWYYSILMNSPKPNADLRKTTVAAPFPSDGKYVSIIGGESLVITKGAKFKPEAWTFIQWMTRQETQRLLLKAGLIPANAKALAAEADRIAGDADSAYLIPFMSGFHQAFYRPPLAEWNEIEFIYGNAMEEIFIGNQNVQEVLDRAAAQIDALLEHEQNARRIP